MPRAAWRTARASLIEALHAHGWRFVRGWGPPPWAALDELLPEWRVVGCHVDVAWDARPPKGTPHYKYTPLGGPEAPADSPRSTTAARPASASSSAGRSPASVPPRPAAPKLAGMLIWRRSGRVGRTHLVCFSTRRCGASPTARRRQSARAAASSTPTGCSTPQTTTTTMPPAPTPSEAGSGSGSLPGATTSPGWAAGALGTCHAAAGTEGRRLGQRGARGARPGFARQPQSS